ncbi:AbrB/MazE/SpoVT family DNA-binding domain-containing protein [Gorillibacterium massiliense]|uniref:AbrB/MazE/SpoVT family DNA-binding domain-containing protein n=1 Tax=Gorillibacterium massiliense TaxID=1280390 RepID=UPI002351E89A|nr:AbrB/MazE/SpoVT family DNA-binding domain-containing protein [Gorillibacterium massiliense]
MDSLGRIVLPKELRDSMAISEGTPIEIFYGDTGVILRQYRTTACLFCSSSDHLILFRNFYICEDCRSQAVLPLKKRHKRDDLESSLREAMRNNPGSTQKELAQMLGISQGRVSQIKKVMDSRAAESADRVVETG